MLIKNATKILSCFKSTLNWKDLIFLALSVAMGIYFKWNPIEIAVFLIFIYALLHPIPVRWLIYPIIILLILTPFFLIFEKKDIADQLAIYAYYFLIMAVIMGIYEIYQEDNKNKDELK